MFNNLSETATLRYNVTKTINAHVKFASGFKSGSFNAVQPTDPVLGPEKIKSYEAGIKSDLFDLLRLNFSGFHYDYSNLQIGQITNSGGVLYANAASAAIDGAEAQGTFAATDDLRVSLSGTYLDAHYASFPAGSDLTLIPGVVGGVPGNYSSSQLGILAPNLVGNRLAKSPEFSGSGSLDYSLPTGFGTFD